jgi:hypothetical protein
MSAGFDNAWTVGDHLTASVFDAINVGNWQRGGDPKARRPKAVPRPSDARRSEQTADHNDVRARAFLDRQKRLQQTEEG